MCAIKIYIHIFRVNFKETSRGASRETSRGPQGASRSIQISVPFCGRGAMSWLLIVPLLIFYNCHLIQILIVFSTFRPDRFIKIIKSVNVLFITIIKTSWKNINQKTALNCIVVPRIIFSSIFSLFSVIFTY